VSGPKQSRMTLKRGVVLLVAAVLLAIVPTVVDGPGAKAPAAGAADGIKKIEHVIIIMQENRSFDHYFGTFPGSDCLLKDGKLKKSIKCNPNPRTGKCMLPYVDHHDNGAGGPHTTAASRDSINGGKMDGYVKVTERQFCTKAANLRCGDFPIDVMGYHTRSDIPNYWKYAKNFVLQDRMFEPVSSWSLPAHLYMVSGWSARCANHNPFSCVSSSKLPWGSAIFAWTDLTYLLHKNGVSWGYYIVDGTEPDCDDAGNLTCTPQHQSAATLGIWNPLPYFDTVRANGQVKNVQSVKNFFSAAKNFPTCCPIFGTLNPSSG